MSNISDYSKETALIYTTPEEQVNNKLYSSLNTFITIKPDQFHNLSGNLYPKKELTNQIGAGMGIEFTGDGSIEEVFGDMEKYPDGREIRKVEGYRCTKHGRRRRPDGTWAQSSPGIYEFNWVNRAELDFLTDEEKKKGKYASALAKKLHIQELKKFAAQRASTGAELVVIRELTGMPTAFKAKDVGKGVIIVSQIALSGHHQAKIATAKIDNIRGGGEIAAEANDAASLLTGQKPDIAADVKKNTEQPEDKKEEPKEGKPPGLKEQFEELKDTDGLDKAAYENYLKTVTENNYSEEVLTWAIVEIMEQLNSQGGK